MSAWLGRTATEIAAVVRKGDADPVAVVTEYLDRIAAVDPALHAFQTIRTERALAEAGELSGRQGLAELPLAGVPIAIKDNLEVAGEPKVFGSAATSRDPSSADHEVVRRVKAAGAVVVGLTTLPELGIFGTTETVFGSTHNPWNVDRNPGGSSGGSAAAVAAGMVPIAVGNDGMGSIRIPAANCGLVGLKPGRGTVPANLGVNSWYGLAENGPLATTVADAALLLSVLADQPQLADAPNAEPRRLRIALSTRAPVAGLPLDKNFVAAARNTANLLADRHVVATANPPYPLWAGPVGLGHWFAGANLEAARVDRTKLEPRSRRHAAAGRVARAIGLANPSWQERWQRALVPFFAEHDVLLTPALAKPAPATHAWHERGWVKNMVVNLYAPFCAPWNLVGYPAIAVPVGVIGADLPVAVQLVAAPGGEALLLGLAAQLEQLRPWPRFAPEFDPTKPVSADRAE
ncbi:MAG TPA: amidase family protein [Actinomycetes bacterium]|nr:amidase family protein [Actinomycetes bacterium]